MRRAQKSRQFGIPALRKSSQKRLKLPDASKEGDPPKTTPLKKDGKHANDGKDLATNVPEGAETEERHWLKAYWRKVGGGSFMVSLGIHVLGLIIAVFIITGGAKIPQIDFLPGGGSKSGDVASAEVSNQRQRKRVNSLVTPLNSRIFTRSDHSDIKLPDIPLDMPQMPPLTALLGKSTPMGMGKAGVGGGSGSGVGIGGQSGFASLAPTLQGRCNSVDRLQKLKESGGSPECETAVTKALSWLKTKQNGDGSWGTQYKCGMTGLAMLSYLGHCETPDSPFYGEQVLKAYFYLREIQNKNRYGIMSTNPAGNSSTYEHGICTYAMGELFSLARSSNRALPGLRDSFERGVKAILDNQKPDGSWAYDSGKAIAYSRETPISDLSVTGWQYQALKAAKYSGLGFNALNVSIDKAVRYMESTQTQDGGFGRTERASGYNEWNLTGVALLGLQTLGHGKTPAIDKGLQFAIKHFAQEPPDWHKNATLYCWYYYSQAFYQAGGNVWKGWNDRVLHQLLENQTKDGNWSKETYGKELGTAVGGTNYGGADEDIYRTTLCTLMLEVYYRYLKVGDREGASIFDRR